MRNPSYKGLQHIPTWKIKEILDDPYTRGIDGDDYAPVRDELEEIYYRRLELEGERLAKQAELDQKALFKAMNSTKKPPTKKRER